MNYYQQKWFDFFAETTTLDETVTSTSVTESTTLSLDEINGMFL